MKKDIHLPLHAVKVIYSNGKEGEVFLTNKSSTITLDIDFYNHPAWNKEKVRSYEVFTEINKFKNKFNLEEL